MVNTEYISKILMINGSIVVLIGLIIYAIINDYVSLIASLLIIYGFLSIITSIILICTNEKYIL